MPDERPPNNPLQQTGGAFGDSKVYGSPAPPAAELGRLAEEGFAVGRSRKDSRRRITVDGVVYRYTVSPDDGFVALIARPDDACGQRLWVKFGYHDDWVPVGGDVHQSAGHRLILPRVVRLAILDGLRRGWNPAVTESGVFRVFDGDSLLPPDEWPRFTHPAQGHVPGEQRHAEPGAAPDRGGR